MDSVVVQDAVVVMGRHATPNKDVSSHSKVNKWGKKLCITKFPYITYLKFLNKNSTNTLR